MQKNLCPLWCRLDKMWHLTSNDDLHDIRQSAKPEWVTSIPELLLICTRWVLGLLPRYTAFGSDQLAFPVEKRAVIPHYVGEQAKFEYHKLKGKSVDGPI